MTVASTESGVGVVTYAQNFCCGAVRKHLQDFNRYQSNSACKSLIYIASLNCFFSGQSSGSLDFKGLQRLRGNLSTKLSTENLEISKAPLNQALSAFFACVFEDLPTKSHLKAAAP